MPISNRTPIFLETTTSLRPSNQTPIHGTTSNWYAIYALEVGPFLKAGDVLDISASLHVTNDAFRPDVNAVAWEASLRLSDNTGDNNSGDTIINSMRPHRIGDEAHHGLLVARTLYEVPATILGTRYIKLIVWFRHPDANGSQDMECPDNALGLQAVWYRS